MVECFIILRLSSLIAFVEDLRLTCLAVNLTMILNLEKWADRNYVSCLGGCEIRLIMI